MITIDHQQLSSLKDWFLPEQPGPQVAWHVLNANYGYAQVDRWPNPRLVLVVNTDNCRLYGDVSLMTTDQIRYHVFGFVEAPANALSLLQATYPDLQIWPRIIKELTTTVNMITPDGFIVRRLNGDDRSHLENLSQSINWIYKTWYSATALAESGFAWGTFADNRLVSVAATYYLGNHYEDIGVVTEPGFEGYGLSTACAGALCCDIQARGARPSWSTSPDNIASLRIAEKLGFVDARTDNLYLLGIPIPLPTNQQKIKI